MIHRFNFYWLILMSILGTILLNIVTVYLWGIVNSSVYISLSLVILIMIISPFIWQYASLYTIDKEFNLELKQDIWGINKLLIIGTIGILVEVYIVPLIEINLGVINTCINLVTAVSIFWGIIKIPITFSNALIKLNPDQNVNRFLLVISLLYFHIGCLYFRKIVEFDKLQKLK